MILDFCRLSESGVDPSAFHDHPMRNVLTNVVGSRPEVEVAVGEFDLTEGQLILLCTDGLHSGLSDEQIAAILGDTPDVSWRPRNSSTSRSRKMVVTTSP